MRLLPGSAIEKAPAPSPFARMVIGKMGGMLVYRSKLLIVFCPMSRGSRKPPTICYQPTQDHSTWLYGW